jgi:hypothetical protein
MAEKDLVLALAARTNLLGRGADEHERTRNAGEFTRLAQRELHHLDWRLLRKSSGNNIDGRSVDKLINRVSGEVADVVFSSEGTDARAQWIIVDRLDPSLAIDEEPEQPRDEPRDEPRDQPRDEPRDNDEADPLETFMENTSSALEDAAASLGRIAAALDEIATNGLRIRLHD